MKTLILIILTINICIATNIPIKRTENDGPNHMITNDENVVDEDDDIVTETHTSQTMPVKIKHVLDEAKLKIKTKIAHLRDEVLKEHPKSTTNKLDELKITKGDETGGPY
jgi:hypothetical protein